jgi:hypothetical protein
VKWAYVSPGWKGVRRVLGEVAVVLGGRCSDLDCAESVEGYHEFAAGHRTLNQTTQWISFILIHVS